MESLENSNGSVERFPSFEEQFEIRGYFDLFGGTVEYVDISPEELKYDVPVIIAPGWGETIETFKNTMKVWVSKGRRVITLNHSRDGGDIPEQESEHPKAELRKAFGLLRLLEEKGIEKADFMAHSEGGINTAIAGTMETEKFRNIVFVNAGGLIGKDSFIQLANRFNFNLIQEAYWAMKNPDRRPGAWTTTKELISYIAENPIRALKESVEISKAETEDMLKNLHNHGVGIVVMNGVDDTVFPMDRMQKILKPNKDSEIFIDGFLSLKGNHNEIAVNPEKYVSAINEMFEKLEEKKFKNEVSPN